MDGFDDGYDGDDDADDDDDDADDDDNIDAYAGIDVGNYAYVNNADSNGR